jgi:hypothetical protein
VIHRSFTGALRTFDENFEKNDRKKSCKRSTSLQTISDLSVVRSQNCSVSDTSMSMGASSPSKTPFKDPVLAAETPPSARFSSRLKENKSSSGRNIERTSSLSANVGIFNTIPQKEAMWSFRNRLITRRVSDGADQSESGSDSGDTDSRDEIYDIHCSGSSSSDGEHEHERAPVTKRKVHSLPSPSPLSSSLPPLPSLHLFRSFPRSLIYRHFLSPSLLPSLSSNFEFDFGFIID